MLATPKTREREVQDPDQMPGPGKQRRRIRDWLLGALPVLLTLVSVAVAMTLGRAMWRAYMETPWTRDGTVRAYVVTMAPEVSGRIEELRVTDNQFVHRGDLLMVIDPTDYQIAVMRTEAALSQARSDAENTTREAQRRARLTEIDAVALEQAQTYES